MVFFLSQIHSSNDLESTRHEQHHAELLRFEDEEVEESYQRLRERERSHAYLHNCARAYCSTMDHTYLIPHLRLIMVQWILCRWSEDIKLVELYIKLVEQSNVIDVPGLSYRNIPSVASTAIGELAISKGRQGREAQNLLRVTRYMWRIFVWRIFILRELKQVS
ncbi:uncharacterized protein LOC103833243 isoform X2 [Brassica rapa]|uniref:uncharacterized protein LOC103833243 isoform X2 n=1 Tax=Brassica campestris TaxID=3711 RepID=UPI00142DD250|nr:uncharacterized protein LOC103833243 isoform X2 [Brassica rapa]